MKDKSAPVYRKVLSDALKITWHYKYLWFLGLLALLFSNVGIIRPLLNYKENLQLLDVSYSNFLLSISHLGYWQGLFSQSAMIGILLFIAVGAVVVVFLWLSVQAQLALLQSVKTYLVKKKDKLVVSKLFAKSQKYVLPAIVINLFRTFIVFLIGGVIAMPILYYVDALSGLWSWLFYPILLLFIFAIAVVSFITFYVYAYIVFYNKKFKEAIKSAENLFKKYWLVSLEMAIFLFIIDFLLSILLSSLAIFIPFAIITILQVNSSIIILSLLILIFLFSLLNIFFFSLLYNYKITSWSLLFLKLQKSQIKSKTGRIVNKLRKSKKKK